MEVTNFYNYGTMNQVEAGATQVNNYYGQASVPQADAEAQVPTPEQMCQAVAATVRQGLWWSNRSWAVVYRVYQMRGYRGSISQFVREAEQWQVPGAFCCNYDALQKPLASGQLIGQPERWVQQGAQKQTAALATALLELLDKPADEAERLPQV